MHNLDPWKKLSLAAQRPRPAAAPAEAPVGFATRVLARLRTPGAWPLEIWWRMAMRALPAGAAVLLVCWLGLQTAPAPLPADEASELIELAMEEVLLP